MGGGGKTVVITLFSLKKNTSLPDMVLNNVYFLVLLKLKTA